MLVGLGAEPSWVLIDLRPSLIDATIRGLERRSHSGWEQSRFVAVVTARAMGAKVTEKAFRFPWEGGENKGGEVERTAADRAAALEKLKKAKAKKNESD